MNDIYFTRSGRDYMITADRSAGYEIGINPRTGRTERILKTTIAFDEYDANNEQWYAVNYIFWQRIRYTYTSMDGQVYTCLARSVAEARAYRIEWQHKIT